jgi:hypothetical protein
MYILRLLLLLLPLLLLPLLLLLLLPLLLLCCRSTPHKRPSGVMATSSGVQTMCGGCAPTGTTPCQPSSAL